jgi:hypothetical protein
MPALDFSHKSTPRAEIGGTDVRIPQAEFPFPGKFGAREEMRHHPNLLALRHDQPARYPFRNLGCAED